MIEIKIPELAESITEGTISKWLKAEGEPVTEGDILIELETDKVNMEINAEHDGILKEILFQEGDTVQVGDVIAKLDTNAEGGAGDTAQTEQKTTEMVEQPEANNHANPEHPTQPSDVPEEKCIAEPNHDVQQTPPAQIQGITTPAVRKLARKYNVDLSQIKKRDAMGRITPEQIKEHLDGSRDQKYAENFDPKANKVTGKHQPAKQKETPAIHKAQQENRGAVAEQQQLGKDIDKPVERVRMTRRRQTIANRLMQAQQNAAMLTTFNEVDMTAILELRKRRKDRFQQEHHVKLGFMSFFTKAVVGALKAHPMLNAEVQDNDILYKKYYDIGIAVAAEDGLVVPVIRHADRLTFAEIESEVSTLANKARNHTLQLSELQGGTFTITNGGIFGSLLSTPILNTPQVGILGMHKIQTRPITVDDDRMENRPMMYIALSYDHRIVDGKDAVEFLVKVKGLLEDPETLLLEG